MQWRTATWNCIMQRHLLILHINATEFSGPKVIWDGPKDSGNVFSGQTSPHFSLFLGKTDVKFYMPKIKKTIQTVTNEKCKNSIEFHVHFSGTMPGLILHVLQQHGFVGIECVCLTGLLQSRSVSYWKCMAYIKRRIRQWRPRTIEQLKSFIHQEWAEIPLVKWQKLISSVPKWLQRIIQRKGVVAQW